MKKYCHNYPTCPYCLEPHITGEKVEFICISNGRKIYRCCSCNTFFYIDINLEEFNIWDRINSSGYSEKKYSFPLLWDINLNEIENAYIDWIINEKPMGKFLVTWPTNEVNFIPILVFEYLSNNPNAKVVIIDNFYNMHGVDSTTFSKPSYKELFSYLYYFDENSFNSYPWTDEIHSDNKLFRKNKGFILKKIKTFHYHLKISGDTQVKDSIDNSVPKRDFKNILDFKNHIKKKLLRDYGNNSINSILLKELGGNWESTKDKVSQEGFLSLKIDERYEWGQNRFFNQSPYLNILLNINKIKSVKNKLKILEVTEELNSANYHNLFIFNSNSEFNIFNEINKIYPSLIIFTNFDEYITRFKFYHDNTINDFSKFMKKNVDLCMLFFSSNKDLRHLYGFNKKNSFIDWQGLIPHTWDNINILNFLNLNDKLNKPPFSSKISKLNKKNFNVQYIYSDPITEIEKLFDIEEIEMGKDFKKFFKYLLQSPLHIFPQNEDFTLFKLDNRTFIDWLNIIQLKDLNLAKTIFEVFKNFYFKDGNSFNPLMEKLVETILNIFNESKKVKIRVIVHFYAKKGVKKLLYDLLKNEDLENMIEVISWGDLNNEIYNPNELSYVIAFSYPFFNYFIYNSPFTNFIFIGGKKHIDKINFIVENRIDINTNSPIYFSINDNAPKLLLNALDNIKNNIAPNLDLKEYFDDYDFEIKGSNNELNSKNNTVSSIKLKSGTFAYLLVDNFGKGLFVPLNHSLTIKKSKYSIKDIDLDDSKLQDLKGKEIILNNDFYTSYKELFAYFVVEHGKNTKFSSPFKKWVGFYQLFSDANLWLDAIHSLVNSISKYDEISIEDSKKLIAKLLISKGIDVSQDRIINYWLSEPKKVETSEGVLGIYELEKPRSYNHLEIIFDLLSEKKEFIPSFYFDSTTVKSSYEAILILQSIRRNFLKDENIQLKYQYLHNQLLKEIEKIIKLSSSFVIFNAIKVSLKEDVYAYKIIENPSDYY